MCVSTCDDLRNVTFDRLKMPAILSTNCKSMVMRHYKSFMMTIHKSVRGRA
jgi:hypothetical protein